VTLSVPRFSSFFILMEIISGVDNVFIIHNRYEGNNVRGTDIIMNTVVPYLV
jgi:hypothetical protein